MARPFCKECLGAAHNIGLAQTRRCRGDAMTRIAATFILLVFMLSQPRIVFAEEQWKLYGKAPADGVYFMPIGYHTKHKLSFTNQQVIGITYRSLVFGSFINSFEDRTWYLGIVRTVFTFHSLSVDLVAGALYGYRGNLSKTEGIPLRNSFLWTHNLNPVITVNVDYKISEYVQFSTIFTPLIICSGLKYNF